MISTYAFKDLMTLPQTIHLRGVCPQFGTFTINFIDEEGTNLLHFSFRIDEQRFVVNENLSGDWGEELEVSEIDFPKGRPFVLRVDLADGNAIRVSLDEKVLTDFIWRTDIRRANRVDLTDVEFALFREGDSFKVMPEGGALPLAVASSAEPNDGAALSEVSRRIDSLIEAQNELVTQVGDMAALIAELKTQYRGVAVGVQTLMTRDSAIPSIRSTELEKSA